MLLADSFEYFREMCVENFGLDLSHHLNSPGLSWDAMLRTIDVTLDVIKIVDMYQFIEKGMRGEVFIITQRYNNPNNKYME